MDMPRNNRFGLAQRVHPHQWLWEPLEQDPTFVLRAMFGAKAVYLDGKIMLCFCAGEEPWRGVLVATDQVRQPALRQEFPELATHPILAKWLHLSEGADAFERVAPRLVGLVRRRDPRIGVVPRQKKRRPDSVVTPHGAPSPKGRRPNR